MIGVHFKGQREHVPVILDLHKESIREAGKAAVAHA
jgi:hypothetical protein